MMNGLIAFAVGCLITILISINFNLKSIATYFEKIADNFDNPKSNLDNEGDNNATN